MLQIQVSTEELWMLHKTEKAGRTVYLDLKSINMMPPQEGSLETKNYWRSAWKVNKN